MIPSKLALVTGSAHRVGKMIALTLASRGFDIILHYHRAENEAKQTQQEIIQFKRKAYLFHADLSNELDCKQLTTWVDSNFSHLNLLVNSASLFIRNSLDSFTGEDFDQQMHITVKAPLILIQNLLPLLKNSDSAQIINILDPSCDQIWRNYLTHSLMKNALKYLTCQLPELITPVRINALILGPILPHESITPQEWERYLKRQKATTEVDLQCGLSELIDQKTLSGYCLKL